MHWYWNHGIDIYKGEKNKKAEDIPIVCKFGDVSPIELPLNEKSIMKSK